MIFAHDFSAATLPDGERIEFTSAEAQLLACFMRHRDQILSRGQILDAISGPGSDRSHRSVDFMVNRLRRKLRDDPKNPRFIATRYGGGYVWLGGRVATTPPEAAAPFLVVGGFQGLEHLDREAADSVQALAEALATGLRAHLESDQGVAIEPDPEGPLQATATLVIGLTVFRDRDGVQCALTGRSRNGGGVFFTRRLSLGPVAGRQLRYRQWAEEMAPQILAQDWKSSIVQNLHDAPLLVAMKDAAVGYLEGDRGLAKMQTYLQQLRRDNSDDPAIKLLWASHIHATYIQRGTDAALTCPRRRRSDLLEIETLVLDSLDFARARPEFGVIAAKLLHFANPEHAIVALDLAENAQRHATSAKGALTALGQLHTFCGDMELGLSYLQQARAMAKAGSNFEVFVVIMLLQALIAAGDRGEIDAIRPRVYEIHPLLGLFCEPMLTDPEKPSLRARGAIMAMSKKRLTAYIIRMYHCWARLHQTPQHRANALRALVSLAQRRHGPDCIPEDIRRAIPGAVCAGDGGTLEGAWERIGGFVSEYRSAANNPATIVTQPQGCPDHCPAPLPQHIFSRPAGSVTFD